MKRLFVLAAIGIGVVTPAEANAQTRSTNAVYAELGGSALIYTINYELTPWRYVAFRAGGSIVPFCMFGDCGAVPIVTTGVHSSLLEGAHHVELGAGVTVVLMRDDDARFLVPSIGYRYQPEDGGFLFRATATPLFRLNDLSDSLVWGGLSAGYGW